MTEISKEANLAYTTLVSKGLENPIFSKHNNISIREKKLLIERCMRRIMKVLNLNLDNDSLKKTPIRISKMYINEIFSGLDYKNFPKITLIDNKMQFNEMIIVRDISLMSTCEHHFITIKGKANIAYIPKNKIIGLSKINRIAQFYSKRPQMQERLTKQILVVLKALLNTEHVAIIMHMDHFCVKARGICDTTSSTSTSFFSGLFKSNINVRNEFFLKK
ncbi:GTP cyclohydrolase I FolE [Buchnera aphidicola (Melanaphis sacchari)]|uniref:GTP cyclohydrolase 1 n=1 Tax=Buchnera aphidicola (Melanaphis sacchari) TaxID=2173854 RepID=A0A2U8DHU7_9GAMM|nr:GTP cyclohydrolase I FolE [Buchnera aphidicola]AWH90774.1 GTP cyclohydrolase I FolE [Buchnera aphidicola (Melanaphis sacchari)]